MSTVKELVLHHLIHTFEKEAWQPPLSFAAAGLTAEQAAWKPGPERHSIWQIVRHVIHWKESVLLALDAAPLAYEALSRDRAEVGGGREAPRDRGVTSITGGDAMSALTPFVGRRYNVRASNAMIGSSRLACGR